VQRRYAEPIRLNDHGPPGVGQRCLRCELDTRIGWHLSRQLELALVGQNLLHAHHAEYGFPGPTPVQIERSVYGKIGWHY
jgi:hypothetical protein